MKFLIKSNSIGTCYHVYRFCSNKKNSRNTGKIKYTYSPVLLENETIVSSNSFAGDLDRILALGTSSGRILSFKLKFKLKYFTNRQ